MSADVRVLKFRPQISPWTLRRERLRRLHCKLAVIDAGIAFVGGINIIDDMHTPRQIPPRFDYAVRVEGPLLADIYPVVTRQWTLRDVGAAAPALAESSYYGCACATVRQASVRHS